jgi:hypothetical protein
MYDRRMDACGNRSRFGWAARSKAARPPAAAATRPQATPRPTPPEAMQLAELRPWLLLLAGVLLLCLQRWFAAKYKLGTGVPLAHTRKLMRSGLAGRSSAKPKQKPKRA